MQIKIIKDEEQIKRTAIAFIPLVLFEKPDEIGSFKEIYNYQVSETNIMFEASDSKGKTSAILLVSATHCDTGIFGIALRLFALPNHSEIEEALILEAIDHCDILFWDGTSNQWWGRYNELPRVTKVKVDTDEATPYLYLLEKL